jgi:hypothetical protein
MARIDLCDKCGRYRRIEQHHIFPLRWFGDNSLTIPLCRSCHDQVEQLIHDTEKGNPLTEHQYIKLALKFMGKRYERNKRKN